MGLVSKFFVLGRQFFPNNLSAKYIETYPMDADADFQGVNKTSTQSEMVRQFQVYQSGHRYPSPVVFINSYCQDVFI